MTEPLGPVPRLRRRAWRTWYRVRWAAWDRRQARRVRVRRVAGLDLVVLPGVLDPAWSLSGDLLAEAIGALVREGDRVLDLGTGCGIGALAAVRAGAAAVVATDVDPVAVRCATASAALTGAVVDIRQGDLFAPVSGERFDLVAFNPPWSTAAGTPMDRAFRLDPALPARFAAELPARLAPGGRAVLMLSTNGRPDAWLDPLRAAGLPTERWTDRDRGSEVLTAWLVRPD